MAALVNNAWWWILLAIGSFAVTFAFGKWCSKGVTKADEEMVATMTEAIGAGDVYHRLTHDKWFGTFCISVFYLLLWPLIDIVYILFAPTMIRGRKDRLKGGSDVS